MISVADQQSAVPNVTGVYGACELTSHSSTSTMYLKGAFYNAGYHPNDPHNANGDTEGPSWMIGFDASRSSKIYTNGATEARPTNIALRYIIKY